VKFSTGAEVFVTFMSMRARSFFRTWVGRAPLAGFLLMTSVHYLARDGKHRVLARPNGFAADTVSPVVTKLVASWLRRATLGRTETQAAENFSFLCARAGVIDGDGLAVGEFTLGFWPEGWARSFSCWARRVTLANVRAAIQKRCR